MDNERIFLCYAGIIIFLILAVFGFFKLIDFNRQVAEEIELREISYKISSSYTNLQEKKDMSCFVNLEFEIDQKKVKLFLDEDMNTVTCGEQIVQFTHYALKSPFTLDVIEYP